MADLGKLLNRVNLGVTYDNVVLMLGGNDAVDRNRVWHIEMDEMVRMVSEDMTILRNIWPDAKLLHGGLLPRVSMMEYNTSLSRFEACLEWAHLPCRQSFMHREVVRTAGRVMVRGRVLERFYRPDGLHLSLEGKKVLGKGWLRCLGLA